MEPSPHLRGVALLTTAAVVGLFVWLMVVAGNDIRALLVLGFVVVAYLIWDRFSKERAITRRYAKTSGRVIDFSDQSDSDGPYYEVTYQFEAPGGLSHSGSIGSTRDLPEQGQAIEILFRPENPEINMPRDVFWFYAW